MTAITGFDQAALSALPPVSDALQRRREEAFAALERLDVPAQTTEEWRYTDLSDLDLSLRPHVAGGIAQTLDDVPAEILGAAGVVGDRAGMQIQHDSTVMISHLDPALAERGVILADLDEASLKHAELVEPYLHRLVQADRSMFSAMHAAFRTGGAFLYVPDGVVVEVPIQTLTWLDVDGAAVFPHTLIVVGEDAEVTFIDRYASSDVSSLSNSAVEIVAGAASRVRYVSIQDWGPRVTHLGVQRAVLGRDSEIRTLSLGFGAGLSRVESETVLAERGAFSEMLGLFFADGAQHFDHRTEQDHAAPNGTSDLLYKGALRDESRAVYSGWVRVRPGAQRTDAMQTSRNIVLSDRAKADAIPNLEIEANDVKCGHAASVGPVEEDTLFYLQSRGISRVEAERLIVFGFFQEVLDRITIDEVRESATAAIDAELARGVA